MGGGGKTHTVGDLSTSHMMNQSDNLFVKDIVRSAAYAKTTNAMDIGKMMQHNISTFTNSAVFERFGVAPKINFLQDKITSASVLSALIHNGYSNASSVTSYSTNDDNGTVIRYDYHFIKDFLSTTYSINLVTTLTENDTILYSGSTRTFPADFYQYKLNIDTTMYYLDSSSTKVNLLSDTTGYYIVSGSTNYYCSNAEYFSVSSIDLTNEIVNVKCDIVFTDSSSSTITQTVYTTIPLPIDSSMYYIIKFVDTSNATNYAVLPKNTIMAEAFKDKYALLYVVKNNGTLIAESTHYKKALYIKLGLQKTDFDKQITSNSDIKSVAMSFSANINNPKYATYINQIYGVSGNRNRVTINGEVSLTYEAGTKGYTLVYNGSKSGVNSFSTEVADDGSHDYMLLPLDAFMDVSLKKKYEMVKETMNIITYSTHTYHTAWYQSGIFGVALGLVAILVFHVPIQLVLGGMILMKIANAISPILGMAVSLFFAYEGFMNAKSIMSEIANVAKGIGTISKYYFKIGLEKGSAELKQLFEQNQALAKKLQQLKKQAIYQPLDYTQNYYDMIYSVQYNYDDMYNYDNLYKNNNMV